ncbi:uncharacterized protein ACJ7VT_007630 [Polymixia lowei]
MNSLEDVPFQTPLGSLEEPQKELVTAPDITIPDYLQTLRDTEYEFTLENWVLTGLQAGFCKRTRGVSRSPRHENPPSCPPYWLAFSSPQESRWASRKRSDLWAPTPRPRSHSLNSADTHRTVKTVVADSEDEAGYSEDDEGSSTDDTSKASKSRDRPRRTASKDRLSRVKDLHHSPSAYHVPPRSPSGQRTLSTLSTQDRQPLKAKSRPTSPLCHGQRNTKRQHSQGAASRNYSPNTKPTQPARPIPARLQQQRPSSAGPVVRNHRQKTLRTSGSHGIFIDSSAELLSALSQEEREILEAITDKGYPLRTAILTLQKTGYRSPEKILNYLTASNRLCASGYDEAQVEEALEMFQNCERKAAEFLRLLTQFNEMGFQQSAIKEVLLVHENHRERALEELMTRMT